MKEILENRITSSDLVQWATINSKDCETNLPLLIRLLIRESIKGIKKMRFPAGDSTRHSGWDGILEVDNSLTDIPEFIPKGDSFWEIGTGEDYYSKAEDDYKKRTDEDKGYDLKNSTFVFVTPRIWIDDARVDAKIDKSKNEWIKRKNDEHQFENVIVYDARDLEEWIQKCPYTKLWLGIHLKKFPPTGIEPLTDFWERWASNPKYKLTPEIVLAGRNRNTKDLKNWLRGSYATFTLKSLTREEAIAFLYSSINSLSDEEKNYYFERSIIIKDIETFINFTKVYSDYILINFFKDPSAADYASGKNHVFIPVTPDNTNSEVNSELNTLGVYELLEELQKLGFDHDEAYQLSKDSGRSLSVLRGLLEFKQQQPEWLKSENIVFLLTALLIGSWDDSSDDDKSIISFLSLNEYEDFKNKIIHFNNVEDPPVFVIGNMWGIRSQYYLWFLLAGKIHKELLKRFFDVVNKVLFEIDPEYFLPEDDRYQAQLLGVKRKYSGWLRGGILNSLILLSIYGDKTQNKFIGPEVEVFVNKLLKNADEQSWFSVANILPQLAEASPEAFLKNIEEALASEANNLKVLFREGKDSFTSRCNHAGLMWALECLAWNNEHLSRVTVILGKLTILKNKESKWSNTPESSLRNIYLSWFPNTTATVEQRITALNALIDFNSDIAFEILLKLMPIRSDVAHPTYKPHWRWFGELQRNDSNDTYKALSEYFSLTLKLAGINGKRLSKLIPFYDSLPVLSDREKLFEYIKNNVDNISYGKIEVREALRDLIMEHRSFAKADWALPEAILIRLEELLNLFPPSNVIEENKWLFDSYFPNINSSRENHKEYELDLKKERLVAVKKLFENMGLEKLINFADEVKEPYFLGLSLAEANLVDEENEVLIIKALSNSKNISIFAQGYVIFKIHELKNEWVSKIIKVIKEKILDEKTITNFLILLKFDKNTWDIVNTFDNSIVTNYWQNWNGRIYDLPKEDLEYAYGKLLEYKRYSIIIDSLAFGTDGTDNISSEYIVRVLKEAATEKAHEPFPFKYDPYRIVQLFKVLDKRKFENEEEMSRLEWYYAGILTDDIWHRPPKLLHAEMAKVPKFYFDIIKAIYKPKDDIELELEEKEGLSEEAVINRSNVCWKILRSFETIPGDNDNVINYDILKNWVDEVIKLSKEAKRETITLDKIGELLAYSQPMDNVWPPEPVCKIIEYLKSDYVDEAFYVSERNKRGTVSKGMFEGGQQELDMEKKYLEFSDKIDPKYIRTKKILKMIAQSYKYDSMSEDERAEQDKMRGR